MITINVDKAKNIAHDMRRAKRSEEFKPLDIQATIPLFTESAEAQRQEIREKYAVIQEQIDTAADVQELTTIVEVLK